MIEECKGNVDAAVSRLLDGEDHSSTSSGHGSSSVERDEDSDDEEISTGPKKRQDRRLSRATRTINQDKEERSTQDLSYRLKLDHLPPSIEHSSQAKENAVQTIKLDDDETEEEDWRIGSPGKDSESASAASGSTTSASDYSTARKPQSGGVRLKLTQPKRHETTPNGEDGHLDVPGQHFNGQKGDTGQQWLGQPKQRRLTSRDKRDKQKADQKAAAKARKQGIAAERSHNGHNIAKPLMVKQGKANAPIIEAHIKVLYI